MREEADLAPSAAGTVLVTGASGFLGSAIARTFAREGFAVRALVRGTSPRTNLDVEGLQTVTGDLTDAASLAQAIRGARYLVHAAADYRLWAKEPSELYRSNVEGTRLLMQAALEEGVQRVVYTSSVAVLAPPREAGRRSTETDGLSVENAIGAYKRSKVLAEEVVRDFAGRGLPVVIVNPSTPIGPRDVKPTPTGRVIVEAASGRMPAFVDTGLNLAHVDDVAEGHLLALRRGRIGERYILGGEDVALSDMLAEIARQLGRKPPTVRLPVGAVMPLAALAEGWARVTGKPPFVSFDALRMARYRMFFDDAKARRELGYTSRPYSEAIADALSWFRQAGMIG
ncbi:hopanoid-associated sugar epimerase [Aureimonas psammosilenae]|uniref:hopanoid-associated sugar epimerase n=1 Tax=Aureimonas psammosilenae TaxID=2495496 RepID=UPI001260D8D4|nr:hopanoid-associated sugar epimerase [Aureimonas psammosilenae]